MIVIVSQGDHRHTEGLLWDSAHSVDLTDKPTSISAIVPQ